MKKLILTATALVMILGASNTATMKVQAGPFLQQGHWIPLSNGGAQCMTHWWLNECKVGDVRTPGNQ